MDLLHSVIYFITVNKYWFFISVIGYINMQIIGIGNKKINIGPSLQKIYILVPPQVIIFFFLLRVQHLGVINRETP